MVILDPRNHRLPDVERITDEPASAGLSRTEWAYLAGFLLFAVVIVGILVGRHGLS